jgi:hypothetical protein
VINGSGERTHWTWEERLDENRGSGLGLHQAFCTHEKNRGFALTAYLGAAAPGMFSSEAALRA